MDACMSDTLPAAAQETASNMPGSGGPLTANLAAVTSFSCNITSTSPANTRLDTSPTAIFPSSLPPAKVPAAALAPVLRVLSTVCSCSESGCYDICIEIYRLTI